MTTPILRPLDLPNLLTLAGLTSAVLAILLAVEGRVTAAALGILVAGVIDMYDGVLARRLTRTAAAGEVGRHLDTVADVCSFGIAPVVLGYCAGLRHPALVALLVLYALACAVRLAYFEATGLAGGRFFTGLPVTYAALAVPLAVTLPAGAELPALAVAYAGMAVLMVSSARIRKPRAAGRAVLSLVAAGLTAALVTAMV